MTEKPKYFCEQCGKFITATREGKYRSHKSTRAEWPGSPFCAPCPNSGARAYPEFKEGEAR